jgi:hypothetical protein
MLLGDYYGPPRQGQSFAEYESYMNMQNVVIGTGLATLAIMVNPIIAGALAVGWLVSGPQKTKVKSSTQGG